jgi:RNA polymerase sigma factor (sigma-70 family)
MSGAAETMRRAVANRKKLAENEDSSVLRGDMTTDAPLLRGRALWMPRDLPSPPRAADAVPAPASAAPIAAGDEHARFVRELFERHRHALLRYLKGLLTNRADAEDVLQETYARLLDVTDLDQAGGRARAYLFKVATNLARDRFRRRKESSIDDASADELASGEDPPEVVVDFGSGPSKRSTVPSRSSLRSARISSPTSPRGSRPPSGQPSQGESTRSKAQ